MRRAATWQLPLAGSCVAFALACAAQALVEGDLPPFVVTPPSVVERMLEMAKVGPQDTLIDLGSGDGRIAIHAAKRHGARALGIEMNAGLVEISRRAAQREGVAERVRFEQGDALAADITPATVLTLYLSPELNERLLPRILSSMRPGSRVLSHDFAIANWAPDRTERLVVPEKNNGRGGESVLMLWTVPARAAGRWRGTIGQASAGRRVEFSLAQQFQFLDAGLHGTVDKPVAFRAALAGPRITLELPRQGEFSGGTVDARIEADRMIGIWRGSDGAAGPLPFEARRIAARPDLY